MLTLDSDKWLQLKSNSVSNGFVALTILKKFYAGERLDIDELAHQMCHQYSVSEVAYAAVPYLVTISVNAAFEEAITLLRVVSSVLIGMQVYPESAAKIPSYLKDDFENAQHETLKLTLEFLKQENLKDKDSFILLGILFALQGHGHLASLIFETDENAKLSCPECGELIQF